MGQIYNTGEFQDHRLVSVPCGLTCSVQLGDNHRNAQTRRNPHLRTGGTDPFDQADHPVHFTICDGVHQFGGGVCWPVGVHDHFGPFAQCAPQLFCDEGHNRVQKDQTLINHPAHHAARFLFCSLIITIQQRF